MVLDSFEFRFWPQVGTTTLSNLLRTAETFISLVAKSTQRCQLVSEMGVLGGKTVELETPAQP